MRSKNLFQMALVFAGLISPALPASIFSITTDSSLFSGSVFNNYDTNAGLSQQTLGDSVSSNPATNILGLTSAFTSMSGTRLAADGINTYFASSFATANLATGSLGVSSSGGGTNVVAQSFGYGDGFARMMDTITFLNTTGHAAIGSVDWTISGSITGNTRLNDDFRFNLTLGGVLNLTNTGAFGSPVFTPNTTGLWLSAAFLPGPNLGTGTFHASFSIPAGSTVTQLIASLNADCGQGSACDFSHTALVNFGLPTGVSFTSASGVLLTAATPEPGSVGLVIIGGVLMAGGWLKRRSLQA